MVRSRPRETSTVPTETIQGLFHLQDCAAEARTGFGDAEEITKLVIDSETFTELGDRHLVDDKKLTDYDETTAGLLLT
ncbi:MAG TPA: hypothetical protein VNE42_00345 [Acidimicrobiales bacterium]|nr:hypothetical protein [Acidimicrobiales bacterium]